jgi:hypothetical protein
MNITDFLHAKPKVEYTFYNNKNVRTTRVWEYRYTGIFGQGYYALTKNGRRHPLSKFKIAKQVYFEYMDGQCRLVETKKVMQ